MSHYNEQSQIILKVEERRIADLVPFRGDRPFREYSEDNMKSLVEDIKVNGVLHPIVVRSFMDKGLREKYEILSGHNRVEAAKRAGFKWIMCNIVSVDDKQATLIYVNANLCSRKISVSERAFAYKLRTEVANTNESKGTNNDIGYEMFESSDVLNDLTETESRQTVYYYMRLTRLIKGLLDLADNGMIPLMAGVDISFLSVDEQGILLDALSEVPNPRVSREMSKLLRKASESKEYTSVRVKQILCAEKLEKTVQIVRTPKPKSSILSVSADICNYIKRVSKKRSLTESEAKELLQLLKKSTDDFFDTLVGKEVV